MASVVTKMCPNCGKTLVLTGESAKIGVVCPYCKTMVAQKHNNTLNEDERQRLTAAIHEMLKK